MNKNVSPELLQEVLNAFEFPGTVVSAERYGNGHINDTFCVVCDTEAGSKRYILQGLSLAAFPDPNAVMENMVGITSFLRRQILENGGDAQRETLTVLPTKAGKNYYTASNGQAWRLTPFIENTLCLEITTPELFEASARSYGRFQYMLRDYPAETLHETIARFHDTENRFEKFMAALKADKLGRAAGVQAEIDFVLARKEDCSVAVKALREGILPLRVTHNDTKLSNILIDADSGEGICVIDLDTTMPGLSIYDFGDSIRSGANHNTEDEADLTKVNFDLELFEVYTRGFLQGGKGFFTSAELEYLPWGARLMTLECGIRFLTDYLDGDNYFRIHYPEQNLRRTRTQFKLVQDMEAQWEAMAAVVAKYAKESTQL